MDIWYSFWNEDRSSTVRFTEITNFKYNKTSLPMKKNMGSSDRIIRLLIAIVLAVLYYTNVISGTLGLVLLIIAAVFVLTSFLSWCPLYLPFGLSTCKRKEA